MQDATINGKPIKLIPIEEEATINGSPVKLIPVEFGNKPILKRDEKGRPIIEHPRLEGSFLMDMLGLNNEGLAQTIERGRTVSDKVLGKRIKQLGEVASAVPKAVVGAGENILGFATGLPSMAGMALSVPGHMIKQVATGEKPSLAKAMEYGGNLASKTTYRPKTEWGKMMSEVAMSPLTAIHETGKLFGFDEEQMASLDASTMLGMTIFPKVAQRFKGFLAEKFAKRQSITPDEIKPIYESLPDKVKQQIVEKKAVEPQVTPVSQIRSAVSELLPKVEEMTPAEVNAAGYGVKGTPETPSESALRKMGGTVQMVGPGGKPIKFSDIPRMKSAIKEVAKSKVDLSDIADPHYKTLLEAMQKSEPLLGKQEILRSAESSKRLGEAFGSWGEGVEGFQSALGKLTGEHVKMSISPLNLPKETVDYIMNQVKISPELDGWERIRVGKAVINLDKSGVIPQTSDLMLMERMFGPKISEVALTKQTLIKKYGDIALNILGIPRSIMASADLSFGLRQGVVAGAKHPVIFGKAFAEQFKNFGSEKYFKESQQEIFNRGPISKLALNSGLSITDIGKNMAKREEMFQSPYAERIPVVGKVVRASGRAYVGMANRMRIDIFQNLVENAQKVGLDPYKDVGLAKGLADVVNVTTGRGSLGKLDRAGVFLNATLFSPRLMASRLNMLNPVWYVKLPKYARMEAVKSMLAFASAGATAIGLAALSGAKVGTDARSADFGKVKIGNTRFDVWGGFQPLLVLGARLATGETKSSTTGQVKKLGKGYKPETRWDVLWKTAIENKFSPVASYVYGALKQVTPGGKPWNSFDEAVKRMIPILFQDLYDISKEDPKLLPMGVPAVFGVGVQTYGKK